ncbi:pisatin demethylase [Trematosphaeria pertusa]|uniref:Pisatin demethylase n=1 Tax=Trematosphaeria pertusa TaxID=390896 RepID=A0A6A6INJ3_9PLEO|nr:pisatin demethylase [Trematosphaeria pertusa]KAF2251956.1 pisatin demethylase [Trematosphaeria pertusa]
MAVLNWETLPFAHLGPSAAAGIVFGGILSIYLFALSIYRLYFHPLARFPGPLFARLTPIPVTWSLLRGRIPFYVKACHDKYGPVVRVSPNELCFDDESAWKDIYGSRPGHKNFHKDPIHVGSIAAVHGASTITMANDADHARQRRALSHAFSTKALLEQEYIVMNYVNIFAQKMQEFARGDGIVDVTDWFAYTTFDVIGDMALGEPFGCLHNEDFRFWVPLISESIKAGAIEQATRRMATTGSPLQRFLIRCIPDRVRKTRQKHLDYSKEKILKRMEQTQSDHRDFLYYVMKQQDKGDLNLNEVIVNGALFIIAGTETTAGFLTGLFNLITRPNNAHILEKLTHEIRSSFKSETDMNFEALVRLPYLTAVIEEGLRMFPSAPIGFVRTVPAGGDTVSGHFVPEGTTVSVCMWAATHSERNFSDPYVFRPERWLDREKNTTDKLGASNPFSLGPRGCIGRNLSYMEMRLIIGKLLWHNDVEMYGENRVWDPRREYENMVVYNNWIKPSLKLKLTPRRD